MSIMTLSSLPKVLAVEDNEDVTAGYAIALGEIAELLVARTNAAARSVLQQNPDIRIVMINGHMPDSDPSGVAFVHDVRENGYDGLLIAASNSPALCNRQKEAGCDVSVGGWKDRAPGFAEAYLAHPPARRIQAKRVLDEPYPVSASLVHAAIL